jgi:predicted RecA/RadA family phage recombinase
MALNIKKGIAHSLQQSDKLGNAKAGEAVVAGMLVHIDSNGDIIKGVSGSSGTFAVGDLVGFAIQNQTDGDVIESGKLGYYVIDGNSVLETDQAAATINAANYPVGTALTGNGVTGAVKTAAAGDRVIGYVEGIRTLPVEASLTQNYQNVAGATKTNTSFQPSTKAFLGIKLAV